MNFILIAKGKPKNCKIIPTTKTIKTVKIRLFILFNIKTEIKPIGRILKALTVITLTLQKNYLLELLNLL